MLDIHLDPSSGTPLQQQIFQTIHQALLQGELPVGYRLPSIRELSRNLNVARITIVMAYDKLIQNGYVKSRPGIGYEVVFSSAIQKAPQSARIENAREPVKLMPASVGQDVYSPTTPELYCRLGVPDPHAFPWPSWRKWNNSASNSKHHLLTRYHSPQGLMSLRTELARFLRLTRGIETQPENVIVINGIQEGLALLTQLFILNTKSCRVVTESPCYSGAWHLFDYYQAEVETVAVDEHGIQVEHLPSRPTQLCYVTPSHQYPVGGTLSLERRCALLTWAQKTGAYVIEDDYDSVFSYNSTPLPALKAMDEDDRVIYIGTFSKTLGPGMRMGYMVCPDAILTSVQNMKALSNSGSNWLQQQFLADFMHDQRYYSYLRKLEQEYANRQRILVEGLQRIFPQGRILGIENGLHLTLVCPLTVKQVEQLRERCLLENIRFDTLVELANGSEVAWLKTVSSPLLFFGFGGLNQQQLLHVLAVIELQVAIIQQEASAELAVTPDDMLPV
ncbi:MocR-like pyridoxine biosynthesis transcription factor PdxR [Limnobaculum parvum]|uniref:PLP-dependent aminotransferase family protein n=1 Tax=Limnobaculum parvum TaxID=2172103 RepID=A0A2Y9TWS7_9GAMM|nr:PLP-dependent aminotransferase family protein [Limnobaculum parvum]AWH88198.1 PLP-dependent aminotransferase family protein [Limnobaculum parvum]